MLQRKCCWNFCQVMSEIKRFSRGRNTKTNWLIWETLFFQYLSMLNRLRCYISWITQVQKARMQRHLAKMQKGEGRDTWLKRSKATWCFFWPPSVFESWPPGVLEPWNGLFCKAANQATWPQKRHDLHWFLIHCDFKETNWYIFEWKVENCTCI